MINAILVAIVSLALAMSVFIGVYTLFRSQSYKKNYFLLLQSTIIIYLLGHLLGLTSANAGEAFAAARVLYIGGAFATSFVFFFICDYCNLKIPAALGKIPMLALSTAEVLCMWTTEFHRLVYTDYGFEAEFFNQLAFTPGPLYSVIHLFPSIRLFLTMATLLYQIKKWKKAYRKQLLLIFVCVAIPFTAEGVYKLAIVAGITSLRLYLTPYSIAVMNFFLYFAAMRFNIFEIIPVATITAMDHIREGFILVDKDGNYLSSNAAAATIIPGILDLAKGESIFSARDWPAGLNAPNVESAEFARDDDDGSKYYRASVSPVIVKGQTPMAKIIIFREITDSVNLMKELENAAYIDALTGLYNRKHFSELAAANIERALRENESIYAVMLDLDLFKVVNDTYGHAAGDMALKAAASIIRQTIRSYDLLGRYGGEEFALLITGLDPLEAAKLMERIRENMERSAIHYEDKKILVTCSIGLAKFSEEDELEAALRKADEALYAAKRSGRNKVKVYGGA